jgi:hypothetical protein
MGRIAASTSKFIKIKYPVHHRDGSSQKHLKDEAEDRALFFGF